MRAVMDNIRSALHSLIDGETHEPPVCTSLRILSLQCLRAHALHYCCMAGFTIQYSEQQKAETQTLSTSLYPHTHAQCLQRVDCSSNSSVAQSDVVDARETSHKTLLLRNVEARLNLHILCKTTSLAQSRAAFLPERQEEGKEEKKEGDQDGTGDT